MREPEGFREFVQAPYPALVRLGALLTDPVEVQPPGKQ